MSEVTQPTQKTERKKPVRLPLNDLGKLLSKVRIDLDMTTDEFAKKAGVATITLNKFERTDAPMTLDFVRAVFSFIPQHYAPEFLDFVAQQLGVLLIPHDASVDQIRTAWLTLNVKPSKLTGLASSLDLAGNTQPTTEDVQPTPVTPSL